MTSADLLAVLNDPSILFVDVYFDYFAEGSMERELLSIFAYGTWADYVKIAESLPPELQLDPASNAIKKIKRLTLLSIFATEQIASFDVLMKELSLDNFVDLESLVIDLIASDALDGKIDQQTRTVVCTRCAARCVKNDKDSIMERVAQIKKIRANIGNALEISNPN